MTVAMTKTLWSWRGRHCASGVDGVHHPECFWTKQRVKEMHTGTGRSLDTARVPKGHRAHRSYIGGGGAARVSTVSMLQGSLVWPDGTRVPRLKCAQIEKCSKISKLVTNAKKYSQNLKIFRNLKNIADIQKICMHVEKCLQILKIFMHFKKIKK